MGKEITYVDRMRERVIDEIFMAFGVKRDGILRRLLGGLFYRPAQRFADIFAAADQAVGQKGLPAGSQVVLDRLSVPVEARGLEAIPQNGPLLVVSNHPGTYDSVSLASLLPRPDLKIIAFETQFYRAMPNTHQRFIYATEDTAGRMITLRSAIQHLQNGGAILQFATGKIEPDPAITGNAEEWINKWSPSMEVMLRKVPQTCAVLAITSGVVIPRFLNHPLTRLRKGEVDRRRIAEFMQVIQHLIHPNTIKVNVKISFALPCMLHELECSTADQRLMPEILSRARAQLAQHMQIYYPAHTQTAT